MSQWFAPFDSAVGGVQDAVTGTGEFIGDTVTGTADVIGDTAGELGEGAGRTAGGLLGGAFGGLGRWLLMAGVITGAVIVATQVI